MRLCAEFRKFAKCLQKPTPSVRDSESHYILGRVVLGCNPNASLSLEAMPLSMGHGVLQQLTQHVLNQLDQAVRGARGVHGRVTSEHMVRPSTANHRLRYTPCRFRRLVPVVDLGQLHQRVSSVVAPPDGRCAIDEFNIAEEVHPLQVATDILGESRNPNPLIPLLSLVEACSQRGEGEGVRENETACIKTDDLVFGILEFAASCDSFRVLEGRKEFWEKDTQRPYLLQKRLPPIKTISPAPP